MYLGIDESNHGRIPEIVVGTFSINKTDIKKLNFDKSKRDNSSKIIYRHILFSEYDREIIGRDNFMVIATCEFWNYFSSNFFPIEKIFIDGELKQTQKSLIKRILREKYRAKPVLSVSPKADETYKLVSVADAWANHLYHYYSSQKMQKNDKSAQKSF
jgi:hypothetical protein